METISSSGEEHHITDDTLLFMDKLLPPEPQFTTGDFSPPPVLFNNPPSSSSMAGMREMIFRIAAMQPVDIDPESVRPPKRRNVRISRDPQSVAARHRRERISHRIRILQRLVPGGTKMDTASMLDEAIHYVKFLKTQVQSLERAAAHQSVAGVGFPVVAGGGSCFPAVKGCPTTTAHYNYDSWMLN